VFEGNRDRGVASERMREKIINKMRDSWLGNRHDLLGD
jgi:hypothetical protein